MGPAQATLATALIVNALLGVGYHVYRRARGGPKADVVGQAILAFLLLAVAAAVASGATWARWAALAYGALFGVVVMPLWTLGVFIPMRPGPLDKGYTALYWVILGVIVIAASAL
jgi:hypothetical protein